MSRRQLAALGVTRVAPHRPSFVGPKSLLAKSAKASRRNAAPEHAMQVEYFAWLDGGCDGLHPDIGLDAFAVPNGVRTGIRQAAKLKAEGLRAGVLDICIDVATGGFFGMRLELKTPSGTVSQAQKARIKRLAERGYYAVVARSLEQAQELTLNYLCRPTTQVFRP